MNRQQPSVVDEVIAGLDAVRNKPTRWYQHVDPKHADTLKQLLAAWKSGQLGHKRKTAAKVIAKILNSRGISDVGFQGVAEWLARTS